MVADVKAKAVNAGDDTAARLGALEAQIAQLTRIISVGKDIAGLPALSSDGTATVSAASAGVAGAGEAKDLVAKLDEESKPPLSAGSAKAAVRRGPLTAAAAAPARAASPVYPDDDDDDADGYGGIAGAGAADLGGVPPAKRLGSNILDAARQHGSFRAWFRNVDWNNARNKHEAANLAHAVDLLLADGVSPELDGMETLMRRLAALQLADATKQYGVTETMSVQPFGGASLLPPEVMERELAKAARLQKLMQPTAAAVFGGARGGRGGGQGRGGRGGAGGGWKKRGGGGGGNDGGASPSGAARDQ